jgi:hypothetical protein
MQNCIVIQTSFFISDVVLHLIKIMEKMLLNYSLSSVFHEGSDTHKIKPASFKGTVPSKYWWNTVGFIAIYNLDMTLKLHMAIFRETVPLNGGFPFELSTARGHLMSTAAPRKLCRPFFVNRILKGTTNDLHIQFTTFYFFSGKMETFTLKRVLEQLLQWFPFKIRRI